MCCTGSIGILRWSGGELSEVEDVVVEEATVEIYLNGEFLVRLQALPSDLSELGVGYVVSEGLSTPEGVRAWGARGTRVEIQAEARPPARRTLTLTTSCGGGVASVALPEGIRPLDPSEGPTISPDAVERVSQTIMRGTELHRRTGATHVAGAFDSFGEPLFVYEDVGRHNAVDKVIGRAVMTHTSTKDIVLAVSGRLTLEMTLKALRSGVRVLVSKSAPTLAAVEVARRSNLTLIGFARGPRFNVYSAPERLSLIPPA